MILRRRLGETAISQSHLGETPDLGTDESDYQTRAGRLEYRAAGAALSRNVRAVAITWEPVTSKTTSCPLPLLSKPKRTTLTPTRPGIRGLSGSS